MSGLSGVSFPPVLEVPSSSSLHCSFPKFPDDIARPHGWGPASLHSKAQINNHQTHTPDDAANTHAITSQFQAYSPTRSSLSTSPQPNCQKKPQSVPGVCATEQDRLSWSHCFSEIYAKLPRVLSAFRCLICWVDEIKRPEEAGLGVVLLGSELASSTSSMLRSQISTAQTNEERRRVDQGGHLGE